MNSLYKVLKNNYIIHYQLTRSLGGIWKPRKSPVFGTDISKKKNIKQILSGCVS